MCKEDGIANRLVHSSEAISITSQFYNKQVMVYVEGPDDVPFWDAMFSRVVPQVFYEIYPVNGKEQLVPLVDGIENGTILNAFVATDLDYNLFTESGRSSSPFIIYTYGHSIENTMFCPQNVAVYIRRAMRKTYRYSEDINQWYEEVINAVRPLLALDILNSIDSDCKYHRSDGSNTFLGRGYHYYKVSNEKKELEKGKIEKEVTSHPDFDTKKINQIEREIELRCKTRDPRLLIQGHFIADAMMNYIRITLKENNQRQSLSNEALYNTFCDCISPCKPLCRDKLHVCKYIERAVNYYKQSKVSV